ncbi:MAG: DUF5132 domain-containing protein [Syntrophobacteraceae bacterium]|jgi:hypothetical protein
MGLFDNGFKVSTALAIGIGGIILIPTLAPAVAAVAKPLARTLIKSGLVVYQKSVEVLAETKEVMEDLTAEAKAELAAEQKAAEARNLTS